MQTYQDNKIFINPIFYVTFACVLLLLPLKWIVGWIVAVGLHELSHYLALRFCGVKVFSVHIRLSGVIIETEHIYGWRESVCALSGPIGGLCLLPLMRWFPYFVICSIFQSLFNLLPIFPLDGGRVLHGVTCHMFGVEKAERVCTIVGGCIGVLLVLTAVAAMICLDLGLLPVLAAFLLLLRSGKQNFLAKR